MKMKNVLLTTLIGFVLTACGQEKIEFINQFNSESEYLVSTKTLTKMKVSYDASEEFINYLKSKGTENPQVSEEISNMKINYITGVEKNGIMPIEIKYLETGKPQDGFIRNGESLRGTYSIKDKIKINEIPRKISAEMDDNQIMKLMGDSFSLEFFNNGNVKIGDSVKTNSPLNIPIGPYQISFNVFNTYILKSINSEKAFFDIHTVCELNSNFPQISLTASGGGSGKCTLDIKNKKVVEKKTELKLIMNMEIQKNVKMKLIQETQSEESTTIRN
jgi:hypothetical protein